MVLELCELLAELAERRASALADCTPTRVVNTNNDSKTTTTDPSVANDGVSLVKLDNQQTKCSSNTNSLDNNHCVGSYSNNDNNDEQDSSKNCQQASSTALKFVSEAQRYVT